MDVREKLIELLQNAKAAMKSENLSCDIARNMFVVDFMMANGVTVQEWISVDERLPESGVHVLLCCEIHRYGGEIAGKYICVYRLIAQTVFVYHIAHGASNYPRLFKRLLKEHN